MVAPSLRGILGSAARAERIRRAGLLVSTGSVGELKEEKRGSVASRCRRAALTCLVRNSLVRFAPARSLAGDRRRLNLAVSPTISIFPLTPDFLTGFPQPSYPPPATVISVLPSAPSRSRSRLRFYTRYTKFFSFFFFPIDPLVYLKNLQYFEGDGLFREDRVYRSGEFEDAPVAGVGSDGLAATAMVMVVVLVVLVPVKKSKTKKKRKKKTACTGGGNSSLLTRTGGGKATLKDRGDVVLAGTRRVFAHVARKENFSTPWLCLT